MNDIEIPSAPPFLNTSEQLKMPEPSSFNTPEILKMPEPSNITTPQLQQYRLSSFNKSRPNFMFYFMIISFILLIVYFLYLIISGLNSSSVSSGPSKSITSFSNGSPASINASSSSSSRNSSNTDTSNRTSLPVGATSSTTISTENSSSSSSSANIDRTSTRYEERIEQFKNTTSNYKVCKKCNRILL